MNDKPTGAAQLIGPAQEGDALVVDTSMIADEDGLGSYQSYGSALLPKQIGKLFRALLESLCNLSRGTLDTHIEQWYHVDSHGTKEILVTSPSETVVNVDDPVQGEIILTGEAAEGQTIFMSTDRLSDEDGIASMSVGWDLLLMGGSGKR